MKYFIVTLALFLTACLSHKDLAQVEANAYEKAVELHEQQKKEIYIQDRVNQFFELSRLLEGTPYVKLLDVSVVSKSKSSGTSWYECDIVMITSYRPHVKAKLLIEVYDDYRGIGEIGMNVNPWYETEIE